MSSAKRISPVYFDYPYENFEDIFVELPPGYSLENLPAPQPIQWEAGEYEIKGEAQGNTLHLQRSEKLSGYFFPANYYPSLRSYFELIRIADDQQATLKPFLASSVP
jgi:hypothetical protein